ncbi:MAG: ribosomal protein L11 methylase PrmA [Planctomycetota bacterium]|jgi:ribosomal protein L11 methylase PrmA
MAVEWLHVHAQVEGVLEEQDAFVVWLPGALPELPSGLKATVEERIVRAEDYHVTGLEDDEAIVVSEDLLVRPPWVERPEGFAGTELIVPRGGAFGSGEHDSTKAALVIMHRGWSAPVSVADVGTGSGILALYANVRGCERIEACDIDEPSVVAARELLPKASVYVGGASTMRPCDLIVANMTGTELRGSMTAILSTWTQANDLILSGMRAHEVDDLVASVPAREVDRETLGAFTAVRFTAR